MSTYDDRRDEWRRAVLDSSRISMGTYILARWIVRQNKPYAPHIYEITLSKFATDKNMRIETAQRHLDTLEAEGFLVIRRRAQPSRRGRVELSLPADDYAAQPSPVRVRGPLPFRKVWDRDDWTCQWCGEHRWLVVDHIVPFSKGGTDDMDNLQTLCAPCNALKADGPNVSPGGDAA